MSESGLAGIIRLLAANQNRVEQGMSTERLFPVTCFLGPQPPGPELDLQTY